MIAVVAAIGILASTFYGLRFVQRAFHGPNVYEWKIPDLVPREVIALAPMIALLIWLGLYPQPVFNIFRPTMIHLQQSVNRTIEAGQR